MFSGVSGSFDAQREVGFGPDWLSPFRNVLRFPVVASKPY